MKIDRIYVDMDGVIVDFVTTARTWPGWDDIDPSPAFWEGVAYSKGAFWRDLPWTPDGLALWRGIRDVAKGTPVRFLSAAPATGHDAGVVGKREWIAKNIGGHPALAACITHRKNKKFLSQQGSLLIDDYGKNCDEWRERGGVAIKHESITGTLDALRRAVA